MKQNWKRTLQGALLGAVLLAMAGCGSTNVMDTYSFGHQVIRVGQSEITIALPYEMGKSTKNMTDDPRRPPGRAAESGCGPCGSCRLFCKWC